MRLLMFILLKLCIFHSIGCERIEGCFKTPSVIYFFEDATDTDLIETNTVFERYLIEIFRLENHEIQLKRTNDMLNWKPELDAVGIHLSFSNVCKMKYTDLMDKFMYAGEIETKPLKVCYTKSFIDIVEHKVEMCDRNMRKVKMVSKSIENYPHLHELVTNFNGYSVDSTSGDWSQIYINECKPLDIVACGFQTDIYERLFSKLALKIENKHLTLKINKPCEDLEIHIERTIAVLTPQPIEKSKAPYSMIIYANFFEEFPESNDNALELFKMDKLKFAFMEYIIKDVKAKRVAIISDDSPISKEFEQEMIKLFEREKIVYGSRTCDVADCDYTKLFKPFKEARAKLVILNIVKENIEEFTRHVVKWPIEERSKYVWLARAWPLDRAEEASKVMQADIYTITFEPTSIDTEQLPSTIAAAINYLFTRYLNYNYDTEKLKNDILDGLIARVKTLICQEPVAAYVMKIEGSSQNKIAHITISPDNHTSSLLYFNVEMSDLTDCMFLTDNYFKPCNDLDLIYIMLVVAVFLITLLSIIFFFEVEELPARTYSRMAP